MEFNRADQPTKEEVTRSEFGNGTWHESATTEIYDIKFDKRGNLWSDGRKVYLYDAYNRLTQVRVYAGMNGDVPLLTGNPIASFTYDGYGHRLTARYNSTDPQTNQTTLDDDPVDIYSYDHLWRIRTVTEATHTQTGWTSFVREQWFYHTGDDPYGYKIGSDAPVMRRIDADGDGIFDETQNFVTDRQGSVVGILGAAVPVDVNNEAAGMKPGEVIARVRYDTYGVPTICDPADIDRDGVVDLADVALYCTYWNAWHANGPNTARYKEILDYNRDGVVDPDDPCGTSNNADFAALTARAGLVINNLVPDVKDVVGNVPLYAGYWWDAQLEMYHVRHRVYRPEWGKWIQRDPLGYAAGWNLYEYVGGEPWRAVDPDGLVPRGLSFWHHLVPQDYEDLMPDEIDIDSSEFGVIFKNGDHDGFDATHRQWNEAWEGFFAKLKKRKATEKEVRDFLTKLKGDKRFIDWLGKGKASKWSYSAWKKLGALGRLAEMEKLFGKKEIAKLLAKMAGRAAAKRAARVVGVLIPGVGVAYFLYDVGNHGVATATVNVFIPEEVRDAVDSYIHELQEEFSNWVDDGQFYQMYTFYLRQGYEQKKHSV